MRRRPNARTEPSWVLRTTKPIDERCEGEASIKGSRGVPEVVSRELHRRRLPSAMLERRSRSGVHREGQANRAGWIVRRKLERFSKDNPHGRRDGTEGAEKLSSRDSRRFTGSVGPKALGRRRPEATPLVGATAPTRFTKRMSAEKRTRDVRSLWIRRRRCRCATSPRRREPRGNRRSRRIRDYASASPRPGACRSALGSTGG